MVETPVTFSAEGFTSVTIWCTKLDHSLDKPIIAIEKAESKIDVDANKDSETRWESFLVDIGRVKEIITVQGFLVDDTTTSALTKKSNLWKIMGNSRKTTITWGTDTSSTPAGESAGGENIVWGKSQNQQTRSGNINKVTVTETAGKIGSEGPILGDSGEKNFAVQLALIVGGDK